MLCPSCNNVRPATNVPCPYCKAPSPLVNTAWGGGGANAPVNVWENQDQTPFPNPWGSANAGNTWNSPSFVSGQLSPSQNSWQDPNSSGVRQQGFATQNSWQDPNGSGIRQQGFSAPNQQAGGNFWSQLANNPNEVAEPQQSFLPVPYQGQEQSGNNGQSLMVLPTAFPTVGPGVQQVNPLLPALPDSHVEEPVYVAPMYTKPRPLIPRYRAISGLLSVIIVFGLLCAGTGYYVQATGKLNFLLKGLGMYTPPKITTVSSALKIPPKDETPGPAADLFTSVALGTSVNPTNNYVPTFVNQFVVGQPVYLSCSIKTNDKAGQVVIKWYTDNKFYIQDVHADIKDHTDGTIAFNRPFAEPTEGKVEIYWQEQTGKDAKGHPTFGDLQLGKTLLFVVEPTP